MLRCLTTVKTNTYALYLAGRDPRVPPAAKIIIALVAAYAISPIDLIPDFIPVIGYLDDLLLVPLGIWLALRFVPPVVWQECLRRAAQRPAALPCSRAAGAAVAALWLLITAGVLLGVYRWIGGSGA